MTKSPLSSSSAAWKQRRIDPKLDFGIGLLSADAADLDLIGHEIDLEPGRTGKPQDMRYSRQVRRQTRYNGG